MGRQAPRFCVADKKGQSVFVGDRITWWTDSWYEGGRTPRMNEGKVIGFSQHFYRHWRKKESELVTKISVKADKRGYNYAYSDPIVTLSNLDNIEKLAP